MDAITPTTNSGGVIVKLKEKRGNVFVFDSDWYAGKELILEYHSDSGWFELVNKNVFIDSTFNIVHKEYKPIPFNDIQTAAKLMQILIEEGLM